MEMNRPKIINGLKVEYDNKIYDKIINFNISTWDDEKYNVSFTNVDSDNLTTEIRCSLKDIKIITE